MKGGELLDKILRLARTINTWWQSNLSIPNLITRHQWCTLQTSQAEVLFWARGEGGDGESDQCGEVLASEWRRTQVGLSVFGFYTSWQICISTFFSKYIWWRSDIYLMCTTWKISTVCSGAYSTQFILVSSYLWKEIICPITQFLVFFIVVFICESFP